MSEVIVITSGKGGVGKTTTTANVGTGLAKLDQKLSRESGSNKVASDRRKFIAVALEQLEDLRKQTISKEIKEKHWHVYAKCEMPEGYDF